MNIDTLKNQLLDTANRLMRFRVALFIIFVLFVYGFLIVRINSLENVQPADTTLSQQFQTTTHIDQATINKINQLQDDSVSVQALFNQARQNPFQE